MLVEVVVAVEDTAVVVAVDTAPAVPVVDTALVGPAVDMVVVDLVEAMEVVPVVATASKKEALRSSVLAIYFLISILMCASDGRVHARC